MVCLAPTGICRACLGSFAGGGWLPEPGYISEAAIGPRSASGSAIGLGVRRDGGSGWTGYDGHRPESASFHLCEFRRIALLCAIPPICPIPTDSGKVPL